jgi:hypothetical protein
MEIHMKNTPGIIKEKESGLMDNIISNHTSQNLQPPISKEKN